MRQNDTIISFANDFLSPGVAWLIVAASVAPYRRLTIVYLFWT